MIKKIILTSFKNTMSILVEKALIIVGRKVIFNLYFDKNHIK